MTHFKVRSFPYEGELQCYRYQAPQGGSTRGSDAPQHDGLPHARHACVYLLGRLATQLLDDQRNGKEGRNMSNVVVIDDSAVVRKIVETSLRRCGITCISYQDGYEALRAFKNGEDYIPDLIFLDIVLPQLDGYDLLRVLKTNLEFQQTTVLMLSGRDGMLDRLKSRLT